MKITLIPNHFIIARMDAKNQKIRSDFNSELLIGELLLTQATFLCVATFTAPLTTLGVSLQLSPTKLGKFHSDSVTEVSRLEPSKSHEIKVQDQSTSGKA